MTDTEPITRGNIHVQCIGCKSLFIVVNVVNRREFGCEVGQRDVLSTQVGRPLRIDIPGSFVWKAARKTEQAGGKGEETVQVP